MTDEFDIAAETMKIRPPKSEAQAVEVARATLNDGCRRVGADFTDPDEDWSPMWLVVEKKVASLLTSDVHKHVMAEAVGFYARRHAAIAIGHLHSSWLVDYQSMSPLRAKAIQREMEATGTTEGIPERIEVLLLATYSASIAKGWTARILRREDRPPVLGLFRPMPGHGQMGGAMVDPLRAGLVKLG